MALAPKPITLTQVDADAYAGIAAPQPFVLVGGIPGLEELFQRVEALELAVGDTE